jgi:hypothetical protein
MIRLASDRCHGADISQPPLDDLALAVYALIQTKQHDFADRAVRLFRGSPSTGAPSERRQVASAPVGLFHTRLKAFTLCYVRFKVPVAHGGRLGQAR